MWSDSLNPREAECTQKALDALCEVEWAAPLIRRVGEAGGLVARAKPLLFEVRFAHELHRAGATAHYEYRAGVGDSTVEFQIPGEREWLVELVSIRASEAAKAAIRQTGMLYKQVLHTAAPERSQSEEAEMITAEQKMGEKVFANDKPTKFPPPSSNIHVILADMRGYLDHGGDVVDYLQMAYGAGGVPPELKWMVHYWEVEPGRLEPIAGLFEETNRLRASRFIRERIHFLGFVRERQYTENEIGDTTTYLANPHLFVSECEAQVAFDTFVLQTTVGAA